MPPVKSICRAFTGEPPAAFCERCGTPRASHVACGLCSCTAFHGDADAARFCGQCGHPRDAHVQALLATSESCSECGCAEFAGASSATFCERCGHGRKAHHLAEPATQSGLEVAQTRALPGLSRPEPGAMAGAASTAAAAPAVKDAHARRRTRRRSALLLAVLGIVLVALAAGGGLAAYRATHGDHVSSGGLPERYGPVLGGGDQSGVRSAITTYGRAISAGHGAGVCSELSPSARQNLVLNVQSFARGSCAAVASALLRQTPARLRRELAGATLLGARGRGSRAVASVAVGGRHLVVPVGRYGSRWLLMSIPLGSSA